MSLPFPNPGAARLSVSEEASIRFNKIILNILPNKGDKIRLGNIEFENIGDSSYGYDLPRKVWDTKGISHDIMQIVEARGLCQSDILA